MPTLSKRVHVARKEYDCNGCDGYIWPGEQYTRLFGNGDDEPMREIKYCSRCMTPETNVPLADGYGYIRDYYKVPVEVGMTVEGEGKRAIVVPVRDRPAHYLSVKREGSRHVEVWHPTWETVYYNEDGSIAADYRKRSQEATAGGNSMSKAIELIAAERERQVTVEGWTPDHDAHHMRGDLAMAAAAYATGSPVLWPWGSEWYKPKDRLTDLVRAGALIAAEIDRRLAEEARKK